MGHVFTLTDGTTTISLVASGVLLENYAPSVPEWGDESVVDTVDIIIEGATGALVQDKARAIDAMLYAANRYHETRTGARVFVTAQLISDVAPWNPSRSELVGGRMELAEDALAVWGNYKVRATLYLERVPYWEGAETALSLSNGNGSGTSGINVYSVNDGSGSSPNKRQNYLQIDGASVVGSLPGPVKLELTKTTTGTRVANDLYIANNAYSDPANLTYIIEAESRVYGGTITADGACSGGSKNVFTAYGTSAQTYWTLPLATLQKTLGRWFRVLVSIRSRTATAAQVETMQAHLTDTTGTNVLYTGPEVAVNERNSIGYPLVDLGAFPIPPGSSAVEFYALQLWITLRLVSGTATTALDYVQLTPTDAFVPLRIYSISMLQNDLIMYDGIDGASYATANGFKGPFVRTSHAPLVVYPGRLQRLVLQHCSDGTVLDITEYWNAKAWYRPRRVSL